MEVKTEKIAEIEQSACANLIVVMLKSLFYAKKGIPMISGAMKTGPQNRWTLVVWNCRYFPQLVYNPQTASELT